MTSVPSFTAEQLRADEPGKMNEMNGSLADARTQPGAATTVADILTAADVGFNSDREFLGYVEAHSQTERALFNNKQIAFMMQLAGQPKGRVDEWRAAEGLWRSVDMRDLVEDARAIAANASVSA